MPGQVDELSLAKNSFISSHKFVFSSGSNLLPMQEKRLGLEMDRFTFALSAAITILASGSALSETSSEEQVTKEIPKEAIVSEAETDSISTPDSDDKLRLPIVDGQSPITNLNTTASRNSTTTTTSETTPIGTADNGSISLVPSFDIPDNVDSIGSFRETISLEVPVFRGLEPSLGLRYDSSFTGLGKAEVNLGVGWQLTGFSSIERHSVGGGVPKYNDRRDIYRLDGMDLMACEDSLASNKLSSLRQYPADFHTRYGSASCQAGGNLVTLTDNYNRIALKTKPYKGQSVEYFEVTRPNGVKYTYESLGVLAGDTPTPNTEAFKVLFERKFLLAAIEDTQATPNRAKFIYAFDSVANARAHRPAGISYGDIDASGNHAYQISFLYSWSTAPLTTYAVGANGHFGQQRSYLASIVMAERGNKIRAYRFDYQRSSETNQLLLQSVRHFGSNYVTTGQLITGGSEHSPLVKDLTYTSELTYFSTQTFSGQLFHESFRAADFDRDGKAELHFYNEEKAFSLNIQQLDTSRTDYSIFGISNWADARTVTFNRPSGASASLVSSSIDPVISSMYRSEDNINPPTLGSYSLHTLKAWSGPMADKSGGDPTKLNNYVVRSTLHITNSGAGQGEQPTTYDIDHELYRVSEDGHFGTPTSIASTTRSHLFSYDLGHFSDSEEPSLLQLYKHPHIAGYTIDLFGIDSSGLVHTRPLTLSATHREKQLQIQSADIDADGLLETLVFPPDISSVVGYDHHSDTSDLLNGDVSMLNGSWSATGDLNGDGAADLIFLKRPSDWSNTRGVIVRLSNGNGFGPLEEWASAVPHPSNVNAGNYYVGLAGVYALMESNQYEPQAYIPKPITLIDINNDGLDDVVIHAGYRTSEYCSGQGDPQDDTCITTKQRFGSKEAVILISRGDRFVPQNTSGSYSGRTISDHVGFADVDGNGRPDIVIEGSNGEIMFNDGLKANTLRSFERRGGARYAVEYGHSTNLATDNACPSVTNLVKSVVVSNRIDAPRRTSYRYESCRFDYGFRRQLGFSKITATLPKLENETEAPTLTTEYGTSHISIRGKKLSSTLRYRGQTQFGETISWWKRTDGGPYRANPVRTRTKVRYGGQLIESQMDKAWAIYGYPWREIDYGFVQTNANGTFVDLDPSDTFTINRHVYPNQSKFIVDRFAFERTQRGAIQTGDRTKWIDFNYYYYDGRASTLTPASHGNLTWVRAWNGDVPGGYHQIERRSYDQHGNVVWQDDALGNRTGFTYNASLPAFPERETNALGHQMRTNWSFKCGSPTSETDANNLVTQYSLDVFCRQAFVVQPSGSRIDTDYDYQSSGLLFATETQKVPVGSANTATDTRAQTRLTGLGEVYVQTESSTHSDPIGQRFEHDVRGNQIWASNPYLRSQLLNTSLRPQLKGTSSKFDPLGRIVEVKRPNNSRITTEYLTHAITIGGRSVVHPAQRVTDLADGLQVTNVFNARGSIVRTIRTDADGTDKSVPAGDRVTKFTYDTRGNLLTVNDPENAQWIYTYDTFNNRLTADDPALGYWTMQYDRMNNLTRQTDAKGQTIEFTYDALHRVTQKKVRWTNGGSSVTDTTTHRYDQANGLKGGKNIGQLTELVRNGHTIKYSYGVTGQMETEQHRVDGKTFRVEFTYHPSGALLTTRYPTRTTNNAFQDVQHRYNGRRMPLSVGPWLTQVTYDKFGNPLRMTYSTGTKHERTYDPVMGWLNQIDVRQSVAPFLYNRTIYNRSGSGRVTRQQNSAARARYNYCYDYAGRLLVAADFTASGQPGMNCNNYGSWRGSSVQDQFFEYRANGSIAHNSKLGGYSYIGSPVPHAPASVAGQNLSYDANGNMENGLHSKVMTYDGENRPLSVINGSGVKTSYIYSADGTRLKKVEKAGTPQQKVTLYVAGLEVRGNDVISYPHASIRAKNGALHSTFHTDQLGSIIATTDQAGKVTERTFYQPYGERYEVALTASSPDEDKGWLGERYDKDAKLQYLNARYYDPELAMFIQPDWFEVTKRGVGTNRYGYSFGDPVNLMDPEGNYAVAADDAGSQSDLSSSAESNSGISPVDVGLQDAQPTTETEDDQVFANSGYRTHRKDGGIIFSGSRAMPLPGQIPAGAAKVPGVNSPQTATVAPRTHVTYTKTHSTTNQVYSGRASGTGTPQQVMARRDANHHMNRSGYGPAQLDKSSTNSAAIRGREQQLIDKHGGAASANGTSGNAIRSISPRNKSKDHFERERLKEFGE